MRIAVDGTPLGSGLGGDETLLRSLLRGLAATARPDDQFQVLVTPDGALPAEFAALPSVQVSVRPRSPGPVHFAVTLPRWLAGLADRPDVVITQTHAPVISPAPVALMVPDISYWRHPEFFPRATRLRLRSVVPRQARRAALVLTISDFSRRDIVDAFGRSPDDVFTVPLIADAPPSVDQAELDAAATALADRGVRDGFVVYLGNLHRRKNVARAVAAWGDVVTSNADLVDRQLVIAGGNWFGGGDEAAAVAAAPPGSVVQLGRVSDVEREVLLRNAAALVYPSLFEGFGLPPLEAMARGTSVVASNTTAIPEVCGDAAVLVDPESTSAIADGLVRVLTDAAAAQDLVDRGRRRAAQFTPERTGLALRSALDAAVGGVVATVNS